RQRGRDHASRDGNGLQWAADDSPRKSQRHPHPARSYSAASLGPRTTPLLQRTYPRLQWGRGQSSAEIALGTSTVICTVMLQWRRGRSSAEIADLLDPPSAPPRFNGA